MAGLGYVRLPRVVFDSACKGEREDVIVWLDAGGHIDALCTWEETWKGGGCTRSATLIQAAVGMGRLGLTRELLQRGATILVQNSTARQPLTLTASFGHAACMLLLLQHSADPDLQSVDREAARGNGFTALMHAANLGHKLCVQVLLRAGANTELCNLSGETAADLARTHLHPTLAEMIYQHTRDKQATWRAADRKPKKAKPKKKKKKKSFAAAIEPSEAPAAAALPAAPAQAAQSAAGPVGAEMSPSFFSGRYSEREEDEDEEAPPLEARDSGVGAQATLGRLLRCLSSPLAPPPERKKVHYTRHQAESEFEANNVYTWFSAMSTRPLERVESSSHKRQTPLRFPQTPSSLGALGHDDSLRSESTDSEAASEAATRESTPAYDAQRAQLPLPCLSLPRAVLNHRLQAC